MNDAQYTLAMYLHLARASELRRRWLVRDKLLLLCARQAQELEYEALAEHCRERILAHNPGHLVGHFPSIAEAVPDEGFVSLWQQAERQYPSEKAEYMVQSLGIVLGRAEATYSSPGEYLASILGPAPLFDAPSDKDDEAEEPPGESAQAEAAIVEDEDAWRGPASVRFTAEEIVARSQQQFSFLCCAFLLLSFVTLGWGMFLFRD